MGINIGKVDDKIQLEVLVQFQNGNGTATEGSYKGTFKRPTQEEMDSMLDPDNGVRNGETIDNHLIAVSGIANPDGSELPAEEQLQWVKNSPECVNAGVAAFLRAFRPARYDGKISKR